MNVESLLLRGLFGASVLACGLALAAMVTASPVPAGTAGSHAVATTRATSTTDAGHAG
jgi:hypothetical protein